MTDQTSQQYFIKYYPALKTELRSAKAVMIIARLEYWFTTYQDGFYKFFEPCEHTTLYRKGDSWVEELGIARRAFNKAFEQIGIRYTSKSDFLQATDKFQGKFYASYYERKSNRTYYIRNHAIVKDLFDRFFKRTVPSQTQEGRGIENGRSRNGTFGRSFARVTKTDKQITTSLSSKAEKQEINKLENKAFPNPVVNTPIDPENKLDPNPQKIRELLKIWSHHICPLEEGRVSNGLKEKLLQTFREKFKGSYYEFECYIQKISSSKFLMGEVGEKPFRINLSVTLKEDFLESLESSYSVRTRDVKSRLHGDQRGEVCLKIKLERGEGAVESKFRLSLLETFGTPTYISWFDQCRLKKLKNSLFIKPKLGFVVDRIKSEFNETIETIAKNMGLECLVITPEKMMKNLHTRCWSLTAG